MAHPCQAGCLPQAGLWDPFSNGRIEDREQRERCVDRVWHTADAHDRGPFPPSVGLGHPAAARSACRGLAGPALHRGAGALRHLPSMSHPLLSWRKERDGSKERGDRAFCSPVVAFGAGGKG